jgi:dsDNA-specific endonuclease/ATPase MutS2
VRAYPAPVRDSTRESLAAAARCPCTAFAISSFHAAGVAVSTPPDDPSEGGDVFVMPIEDSIDLHGFQPRDVVAVVADYLEEAVKLGFEEVRLIHGRGKGVQRASVQAMLAGHPLVASFRDASAARGGWGATIVELRSVRQPP